MKNIVLVAVKKAAKQTTWPVFAIYDDTIFKKTKPSSQASHPRQGAGFFFYSRNLAYA